MHGFDCTFGVAVVVTFVPLDEVAVASTELKAGPDDPEDGSVTPLNVGRSGKRRRGSDPSHKFVNSES